MEILTNAVKKEITSLGRAVAINGLAIHLYQQLAGFRNTNEEQLPKLFDLLILATEVSYLKKIIFQSVV